MILAAGFPSIADFARASLAIIGAGVALGLFGGAARGAAPDPRACQVSEAAVTQAVPLPHVAQKRHSSQPLKIVAIGSSSTSGAGASSPQHTYPAQLAAELARLWPQAKVEVVNRGVGGERSHQMLARFARDVLVEKPDLVVWQLGTNGTLQGDPIAAMRKVVLQGIDNLQQHGIDVILMTPQFAPRFNEKADHLLRVEVIRGAARDRKVGVFRRFEIMHEWIEDGRMTFASMLSPDGLHLTDLSYACIARLLAAQIDRASRNLPAVAMPRPTILTPPALAPDSPAAAGPVAAGVSAAPVTPAARPTASSVSAPAVKSAPVSAANPMVPNTRF